MKESNTGKTSPSLCDAGLANN